MGTTASPSSSPTKDGSSSAFKWTCLLVAVVALSAFGWMLNDMRLEVKALAPRVERLTEKAEDLADRVDRQLPKILAQTERGSKALEEHLPLLLARTEKLLDHSEMAVDNISEVADGFKQYKGLMGVVHAAAQTKSIFSYGSSILSFLSGSSASDAKIGSKAAAGSALRRGAVPAKEWAAQAQNDAHFISLGAKTREEMLHGLPRTKSASPLHIQIGDQAPRLLADWLKEKHPESKDVN